MLVELPLIVALALLAALSGTGILLLILRRRMTVSIQDLEAVMMQVMAGDYEVRVPVSSAQEFSGLVRGMNKAMECMGNELAARQVMDDVRFEFLMQDRRRLAQDMHGSTAQVLGFVKNKAFAARILVEQGKPSEAVEELRQLEESVGLVFQDLRQTIRVLKEPAQALPDFRSLLTGFLVWFEANYKISVDLNDDAPQQIQLPDGSIHHILRIVQEALSNTAHHAQIRRAAIDLRGKDGQLEVIISDEGSGFDPGFQRRSGLCFGLKIMDEYARQINAKLYLRSSMGVGTQVILEIPLVEGVQS